MCVDVGANDETDKVEEWHPRLMWEKSLRKSKRERRYDPRDFHDWPETSANSCANLVKGSSSGNDCHAAEIDNVLDRRDLGNFVSGFPRHVQCICLTYDKIRDKYLHDLRTQARSTCKQLLKN